MVNEHTHKHRTCTHNDTLLHASAAGPTHTPRPGCHTSCEPGPRTPPAWCGPQQQLQHAKQQTVYKKRPPLSNVARPPRPGCCCGCCCRVRHHRQRGVARQHTQTWHLKASIWRQFRIQALLQKAPSKRLLSPRNVLHKNSSCLRMLNHPPRPGCHSSCVPGLLTPPAWCGPPGRSAPQVLSCSWSCLHRPCHLA